MGLREAQGQQPLYLPPVRMVGGGEGRGLRESSGRFGYTNKKRGNEVNSKGSERCGKEESKFLCPL